MKTYRRYEPDQILLLPPSLKEWVRPGHLCHFVSDLIETADLSAITSVYEEESRGFPPYHPVMMTKLLVYGYCTGVVSSRAIERHAEEDVAFRLLAANNAPDFRTIATFRRRHLEALSGLFLQVLRLCQKAKLIELKHVALDGTKLKANASRDRTISYAEAKDEEARLKRKIKRYFETLEENDRREDELHGPDNNGFELPAELQDQQARLRKIRELKAEMEREAQEAARKSQEEIDRIEKERGPHPGQPRKAKSSKIDPDTKRNLTDHDSRLMPVKGGFIQGYNCQAAVDEKSQVIVASSVEQGITDAPFAAPMIEQVVKNFNTAPQVVTMDAGYFGKTAIESLEAMGCDVYTSPGERTRGNRADSIVDRIRKKLSTPAARKVYLRRGWVVEPVFGQIKEARGFRKLVFRGIQRVRAEWSLICTGHNILKLWRAAQA